MCPAYQSGRGNRKSMSAEQTFRRNLTHMYNRKRCVCVCMRMEDGCALTQISSDMRSRLPLMHPAPRHLQPPDKPAGCILKKSFSFSFLPSVPPRFPSPPREHPPCIPRLNEGNKAHPAEHGVRDATKGGERTIINETKLSAVLLTTKAGLHEKKKKKR